MEAKSQSTSKDLIKTRVLLRRPNLANPSPKQLLGLSELEDTLSILSKQNSIELVPCQSLFDETNYIFTDSFCIIKGPQKDEATIHCLKSFYEEKDIIFINEVSDKSTIWKDFLQIGKLLLYSNAQKSSLLPLLQQKYPGLVWQEVDLEGNQIRDKVVKVNSDIILLGESVHVAIIQCLSESSPHASIIKVKLDEEEYLSSVVSSANIVFVHPKAHQLKRDLMQFPGLSIGEKSFEDLEGTVCQIQQILIPFKSDEKFIRKLGTLEEICIKSNLIVPFIAYINGPPMQEEQINLAARKVLDKHPILRTKFTKTQEGHFFKYSCNPYFEVAVIRDLKPEDERAYIEDQMNVDTIDKEGRLFNMQLIIQNGYNVLLLLYHHSVADGIGGTIITNDFLNAYTKLIKEGAYVQESLAMLQSTEDLSFPQGLSEEQKAFVQMGVEYLNRKMSKSTSMIPYEHGDGTTKRTKFEIFDGTEENLKKVHAKCKELGITIGSTLMASAYFARQKYIYTEITKDPLTEIDGSIDIDINLRDRYPVPLGTQDLGMNVAVFGIDFKFTKDKTFWGFAKEIHSLIGQELDEQLYFLNTTIYGEFLNPENLKKNNLSGDMANDFNLSNIGRYRFNPFYSDGKNQFKVDRLYCSTHNAVPGGSQYVYLCLSVDKNCYTLCCNEHESNYKTAMTIFKSFCTLHEKCHQIDEQFTFGDYLIK